MKKTLIHNTKCAIYARVSTESIYTKKESISNQVEYLIDYAKEHEYTIVEVYKDDGYSGGNLERPGFKRMIEDMYKKYFDTILVTNLSRFSRNYLDAGLYIDDILPTNQIRLIAPGDNYDSALYNDEQSITLKLWLNDMFLKDIGNKIRYANKRRAQTGYMNCGSKYGFRKEDGVIYINEEEAEVIRLIFELYIEGVTCGKIVKKLRENKIYTPAYKNYLKTGNLQFFCGKKADEVDPYSWQEARIRNMLSDPEYNGCAVNRPYRIKNGIRQRNSEVVMIKNAIPKIIDDATYEKAQEIKKKNMVKMVRVSTEDRLDMVYCAHCGHKLSFDVTKNTERRKRPAHYECIYCKENRYSIRLNMLIDAIVDDLEVLIEEATNDTSKLVKLLKSQYLPTENINELMRAKTEIDKKIQKTFEDYMIGKISQEVYDGTLAELNNYNNELEKNISYTKAHLASTDIDSKMIQDFSKRLKGLVLEYDREDLSVFKSLISRVEIRKLGKLHFEAQIYYKFKS